VRSKQPEASEEERGEGQLRLNELNEITANFILRRTQEIISKFLPPKVENVIFCKASETQAELYRMCLRALNFSSMNNNNAFASLAKLRAICNHPCLLKEKNREAEAKLDVVERQTGEYTFEEQGAKLGVVSKMLCALASKRPRERIVLASYHTRVLDLLAGLCDDRGFSYCRLDGSTAAAQRQTIINGFNSSGSGDFVMLLSAKAGGTGLNLVGASRMVLFDLDWNPANDVQGELDECQCWSLWSSSFFPDRSLNRKNCTMYDGGSE